jgi:hypothetical protein
MEPLLCRDLAPGDVMLKILDNAPLSLGIASLQALSMAAKPYFVHAGVMFDKTYIIEAAREGIRGNDLRVQNKKVKYLVYRCADTPMAQGAATCAKMLFDIHQRRTTTHRIKLGSRQKSWRTGGPLAYSVTGALKSLAGPGGTAAAPTAMDDLLSDILDGQAHPFFCSHFVVYVYQFVGVQCGLPPTAVFKDDAATVNPSALAGKIETNPYFNPIGYMQAVVR